MKLAILLLFFSFISMFAMILACIGGGATDSSLPLALHNIVSDQCHNENQVRTTYNETYKPPIHFLIFSLPNSAAVANMEKDVSNRHVHGVKAKVASIANATT